MPGRSKPACICQRGGAPGGGAIWHNGCRDADIGAPLPPAVSVIGPIVKKRELAARAQVGAKLAHNRPEERVGDKSGTPGPAKTVGLSKNVCGETAPAISPAEKLLP